MKKKRAMDRPGDGEMDLDLGYIQGCQIHCFFGIGKESSNFFCQR